MNLENKNTTNIDLSAIIEGLLKADIKFILVGGLAAVIQGAPITTMDVAIVYHRSDENISKLFSFLTSIDAVYRRPDNKVIAPTEQDLSGMGYLLFSTRLGPLDVLAFIEQGKTYEDIIEDTIEIEFRDRILHVIDIKKLIELKRNSNDSKDKRRLPILEETLQQLNKGDNISSTYKNQS